MKLLLVEDDARIVEFLARGLRAEGHQVEVANDGQTGLDLARSSEWDSIILDLMLPILDGREICRSLRMEKNATPVLMLTALDSTEDIVRGLQLGADEYLTKPFAFDELLARLENLQRRLAKSESWAEKTRVLTIDDLTFDREALIVRRAGVEIEMTSLEYALLEFLMVESGKVVSRARILQNVWGAHEDPLTNVVDVYIRRLRIKIDDEADNKLISTIRGRGYRMTASMPE
ncbi:response regulator transcription factor [Pelagibius sp. Alg239-R121]|uniref:response regulator transcription factor n=1 Tax=Pelagibius sp. Alg239-R121 TaxID=2993448 RepID=UPI0024A63E7F|nr:response regulator transcription factor [Pelagibius sp. Alg239-R121]